MWSWTMSLRQHEQLLQQHRQAMQHLKVLRRAS